MSCRKDFRILSLDGGGIRGAFTASFLRKLADAFNQPLHEHFDLIAGTSTGGIIAAAVAFGIELEKIEAFYREAGPKIFVRRKGSVSLKHRAMHKAAGWIFGDRAKEIDVEWLLGTKYDSEALHATLSAVFGQAKVKDAKCLLTIPAVDLVKGQTVVLKTANFDGLTRDPERSIVDVLMATAAAPTYFPHATIEKGSAYVDGGLWANNPTLVAYAEAAKMRHKQAPRAPADMADVRILSIGTGSSTYSITPPGTSAGFGFWLNPLFEVMGTSQSQGVDFAMRYLVPETHYMRVDFQAQDSSWTLDNIGVIEQLCHLGREKASEELQRFKRIFQSSAN